MIHNLLKNFCLITFALIGPITLPAGGIQKSVNSIKYPNNIKEITRNWKVSETEIWVRVELASNKLLDDPNKITKGWIKI